MHLPLLLALALTFVHAPGVVAAPAQQLQRKLLVYLRVITEPADLRGRFEPVPRKEFEKYPQVELTEEGYKAVAVLWIYAARTAGSQKDPDGVSVAIVHTRPGLIFLLMANQDKLCAPDQVNAQTKTGLLKLEGSLAVDTPPLSHINAAHLDQLDDNSLTMFAAKIVADFVDRTAPKKP